MNKGPIQCLLERIYGGDVLIVPTTDYLAMAPISESVTAISGTQRAVALQHANLAMLPNTSTWLET